MTSAKPCIVCDSRDTATILEVNHIYQLIRCSNCAFVWAIESATGESRRVSYEDYGSYLLKQSSAAFVLRTVKYRLFYREVLKQIKSSVSNGMPRLLDIGAGNGSFVAYCRSENIQASGVEPSKKLRVYATTRYNVQLFRSSTDLPDNSYDVVTAQDVIEHIPPNSLQDFLGEVKRLLSGHGLFIGNTPNFDSINRRILGAKEPIIAPPHHVSYFSPISLDTLLTQVGFKKVHLSTLGLSPFIALNASHWAASGMRLFQKSLLHILSPAFQKLRPLAGYQINFAYRMQSMKSHP
jgi:hypothetical protein